MLMTRRDTLCAVPGSMLACMFEKNSSFGPLAVDETGAVFMDADPDSFAYILSLLRRGCKVVHDVRDVGLLQRAKFDAKYYGLDKPVISQLNAMIKEFSRDKIAEAIRDSCT